MSNEAWLRGQILTDVSLADLADAFRRAGLDTDYHQNPHGDEEVFVNGAGDADAECLLQPDTPGEYLVVDSGGERGAVEEMARTMSTVLTGMRIIHRLEMYGDDREMFAYLNHGWPLDSSEPRW